jgi:DNA processing protein
MNLRPPAAAHPVAVSDAEIAASIGLGLLPGIGPRTIRRWIEGTGSAGAAWAAVPNLVASRADAAEIVAAWRAAAPESVLAQARARGMTVLAWAAGAYPPRLRTIPDPPAALFVRGDLSDRPVVAVVGARRATPYGRAAASQLAAELALSGVTVVSGLARGIDAAAHQAALDAGGRTIAVLGCGADVIYPREHRRLAESVAAQGAIITEFAPGTPPLPGHFPRRNRLISGLALGVIVVEGAEDSGALVTVEYALDQGRDVFAVPGSIFSPKSRAPHELLRQGACLVERASDVLQELGVQVAGSASEGGATSPMIAAAGPARGPAEELLALLEAGPRPVDELIARSTLPAAQVAAAVTTLELRGLIQILPGQMVMRTPQKF